MWFKDRGRKSQEDSKTQHIRGPKLSSADEVMNDVAKDKLKTDIQLGSLKLPVKMETRHVCLVGSTGTGKTTLLMQALERLKEREELGMIYDYKGDFVAKFYDPARDFILNPADERCVRWRLFNEVMNRLDIEAIATSLIPSMPEHKDAYWRDACRDIFIGILLYLEQAGKTLNRDIWNALNAPIESMQEYLEKTDAGRRGLRHIEDPRSRQTNSVLSTLNLFTAPFEWMADIDGDFSFYEWLRKGQGWVFILNTPKTKDTFKPLFTLAIDLVARDILTLCDNEDRRIFMLLDEIGTLHKLSSLVDILTLGRSKGASLWLGTQDFGRIKNIYGDDIAETIFNNCSTRICYRVNAPETAALLQKAFGEREISVSEESVTMDPGNHKIRLSYVRRNKMESIILAGEIMELPDLSCYIKMGPYHTVRTRIPYKGYPVINDSFKECLSLQMWRIRYKRRKRKMSEPTSNEWPDSFD